MSVQPPALVARGLRSLRNRGRVSLRHLRGACNRAALWGSLRGAEGLEVGRGVALDVDRTLVLGRGVVLSDGCALEVAPGATMTLGDGVWIGRGTVLCAQSEVTVGARTLVAEQCSIRDQDHHVSPGERAAETTPVTAPVRIGGGVWIGAGARVLRGCSVGDGAVVAANAVVRSDVPARTLVAGVPARAVRVLGPP